MLARARAHGYYYDCYDYYYDYYYAHPYDDGDLVLGDGDLSSTI